VQKTDSPIATIVLTLVKAKFRYAVLVAQTGPKLVADLSHTC